MRALPARTELLGDNAQGRSCVVPTRGLLCNKSPTSLGAYSPLLRGRSAAQTHCRRPQRLHVVAFEGNSVRQGATDALALPAEKAKTRAEEKQYDWGKQWYPLAVAADLDPDKPHGITLLGKEMVLWRDASQEWRCFEDKCAHRNAPLSEGRIEPLDHTLMCSYHGWRYGGDGRAVSIPQARLEGAKAEATACASSRACMKSHPTKVMQGLIWVWPENGPAAFIESATTAACTCPYIDHLQPDEYITLVDYYVRDMPGSFDTWIENISDQSHVPWAHHGVAHNRESEYANFFKVSNVNKELTSLHGATFDLEWSPNVNTPPDLQKISFTPPTYIGFYTHKEGDDYTILWFYVIPLDAHTTRIIDHAVVVQKLPGPARAAAALLPRWAGHLFISEVFDGDIPYIYKQSRTNKLAGLAGKKWNKEYYLPGNSDGGVVAFRKWFHTLGGNGPEYTGPTATAIPPVELARETMLDRHEQHTRHCPDCQKALQNIKTVRTLLNGTAAALGLAAVLQLDHSTPLLSAAVGGLLAAAVASAFASSQLRRFQTKFVFTNYVHADR